MKSASKTRYLGNVICSNDGSNATIIDRHSKGIGIVTQIVSILKSISLGPFYFRIALILRESMLLNAILVNLESMNHFNKKQIEMLESIDNGFFVKCFSSSAKTVRDAFSAETGKLKVRYILAKRRFMFLHNILRRNPDELVFKVYQSQKIKHTKMDFYASIESEKKYFELNISDEDISRLSKENSTL